MVAWLERFRYLRYLTPAKFLNLVALVISFYLSKWTGKVIPWGQPAAVSIEPTTACNLRCPECPSGLRAFSRPTGNLKQDFFRSSVDQLKDKLLSLVFYFQGEPYINPDFLDMVSYAHHSGIYTMTSTNGHFLDDENCERTVRSGLDKIIISVDGVTQESYSSYRVNGNLNSVIEGTKRLIAWKKKLASTTPYIIYQFLVVRPNEQDLPAMRALAAEIGVDELKVKTAQIYDYKNGHPLIPENEALSRYRKTDSGHYEIKNKLNNSCWKMWHSCVITWDGTVVPCCFDKDAKYALGNLKTLSFKTIWHGPGRLNFSKRVLTGRNAIDICTNCTAGCQVWASS